MYIEVWTKDVLERDEKLEITKRHHAVIICHPENFEVLSSCSHWGPGLANDSSFIKASSSKRKEHIYLDGGEPCQIGLPIWIYIILSTEKGTDKTISLALSKKGFLKVTVCTGCIFWQPGQGHEGRCAQQPPQRVGSRRDLPCIFWREFKPAFFNFYFCFLKYGETVEIHKIILFICKV